MRPERYLQNPQRYEPLRMKVNTALAFAGLKVNAEGILGATDTATTTPDAERRARKMREDLVRRGVHPDVLSFCRSELLVDDYFHAVLEATKSVGDKIRSRTGLMDDGSALVDRALIRKPGAGAVRHVPEPGSARAARLLGYGARGRRGPPVYGVRWSIDAWTRPPCRAGHRLPT